MINKNKKRLLPVLSILAMMYITNLPGQDNRNEMDWANLTYYQSANATLLPPSAHEKRVVFLGNSITEFWFSTDSTFGDGKPYINRGISGQTSLQMLIRFRQDVIDLKPSVVVILAGINDIAENMGPTTLEAILDNIVSMTELALANDIRVVLCSVLPAFDFSWRPGLQPAEKIEKLNRMIASYCRENNIDYVDYHTPMADERKGLQYIFGEDGVHPNLTGYKFMEPLVEGGIAKALKRK